MLFYSLEIFDVKMMLEAISLATWKKPTSIGENGDHIQREKKEADPQDWWWEENIIEFNK